VRNLGISIYPSNSNSEKIKEYISIAAKYGFKRIFTCLISSEESNIDDLINKFKNIIQFANEKGMSVVGDVEPKVFKRLKTSYSDLSIFKDMGFYGIRLDLGFSGIEESIMSFNKYGIKVELNMSNGTKYIDNILTYKPNLENILGCHNFYPHRYTGLSYNHFIKCSKQFKDLGIRTAAFVSSNKADHGPWPVSEGLSSLEMHRELPIEVQAKHLFSTGFIDDVIIGNAFASEEELKALSKINKNMLKFKVNLVDEIPDVEKTIILDEFHFNRGDISDYMIRSTQSRIKYKDHNFEAFNTVDIKRGDILIESSLYKRYAGELQIALKNMGNSGKTNVVGRIADDEVFLIDYLEPWDKFGFNI